MMLNMPGISQYYGRTPSTDEQHMISFRDFLQYIVDHGLDHVDSHFKSVEQLCEPCIFPYNIIVKVESAPEDLW